MRCAIHSAESGSVMVIPRENKLVRLYIQLNESRSQGQKLDRSKITPEAILKSAQKIMSPYNLKYDYCDWWTAYEVCILKHSPLMLTGIQIGQRVGDHFDADQRIFLAGDAVHTHSPKAGQGMNVSMQDTYNLGWKIGLVVNGLAKRSILKTYQSERRRIAKDLIDFDHRFSRLFSGRPAKDAADEAGISMAEFKEAFKKANLFTSGLSVNYGASMLVAKAGDAKQQGDGTDVDPRANDISKPVGKQHLATNIELGKRIPSFQVLNQADARPWPFASWLKSNGSFRVIVFAGNLKNEKQWKRVHTFGKQLEDPKSFLRRFTLPGKPADSVIDLLAIHSAPRRDVELLDLPDAFHPFDEKTGYNYDKVFVDDESYHEGHGQAYKNYGVDAESGCVVIIRPDQ